MMILYLNSLYNMLVRHNPVLLQWREARNTMQALWRFRDNRRYVRDRHDKLSRRLQTVQAYVHSNTPVARRHHLDVTR